MHKVKDKVKFVFIQNRDRLKLESFGKLILSENVIVPISKIQKLKPKKKCAFSLSHLTTELGLVSISPASRACFARSH